MTAHQPTENFIWNPPTLQELVATVRKAEGQEEPMASLDKNPGRHLPEAAIAFFRCQAVDGKRLEALHHSRMVNMAKPKKVNGAGIIPIEGCKPITVLSAF